uniref:MHC class I-like antigen recognition-like domain-containing protein n=1 Tax=Zonotrichia albicollis TaxID=44394 RepID=A0A8D2MEH9_ZONAL
SAMAAALGLGLLLGLLGDPGGATKVLHSLHYLDVAVSEPSPGIPQYMSMGYLDGIPFTRYDSERGREEPLSEWVKDSADPEYWERNTQLNVRNQYIDARNLETLRERYNQSGGLHTLLRVYGCELLSDGSIGGSQRHSYDGRDFISFDLESGRFMAADSAAEITRRRWEQEGVAEARTNYLKHECLEWLQRHVRYGQKELERKGGSRIPVGIWDLGMEDLGTQVEHPGMPEPGIFAWGEAGNVGIGNLEFPNGDSPPPPHYPVFPRANIWWESHCGGRCVRHRCHPHPHCPHWIRHLEAPIR